MLSTDDPAKLERPWIIYALLMPPPLAEAGVVRYVGVTTQPLAKRLAGHCREAFTQRNYSTHKNAWLRKLMATGLRPIGIVLESGAGIGWVHAEQFWIAHFRAIGAMLTNSTDGGDGAPGVPHTPEHCAKISAALTGRKCSREAVEKAAAAIRGRKMSDEHRAKMQPYWGPQSRDFVERRTAPLRGRKRPREVIARIAAKTAGQTRSSEQRAVLSESARRRQSRNRASGIGTSAIVIGLLADGPKTVIEMSDVMKRRHDVVHQACKRMCKAGLVVRVGDRPVKYALTS